MKKIERVKSTKESNLLNETIGQKLSEFRKKLNEIVDYINEKEQVGDFKKKIEEVISEVDSEILDSEDIETE
jgi:hypothetical protein